MTEMREDMNTDFDSNYKIGIVSEWSLNPKVTDKFLEEIWKASTEILPHLEVQVVIDDNDKLFISSGSPSYVDFQINPVGMKLPIKCFPVTILHPSEYCTKYLSACFLELSPSSS